MYVCVYVCMYVCACGSGSKARAFDSPAAAGDPLPQEVAGSRRVGCLADYTGILCR